MANTRRDFSDKLVKCKKCRLPVGWQRLDAQVLVIGSLAFMNFARFVCLRCNAVNGWQSVNLPPDERTMLDAYPDRLEDLPKPEKRIVNQLGVKGVTKAPNGKFKARIIVKGETKYLGLYDSIGAASKAYEKAKSRFQV